MDEYEALKAKQAELLLAPAENALALNSIGEEIDLLRRELNLPLEQNGTINPPDPADSVN